MDGHDRLVDAILAALDAMPEQAVRAVGAALTFAPEPIDYVGGTLLTGGPLRTIRIRRWLRVTALRDDADELLERLEDAEDPFWAALREGLAHAVEHTTSSTIRDVSGEEGGTCPNSVSDTRKTTDAWITTASRAAP